MRLPQSNSEDGGPNLTPIIDVVFLLLIFFLVATRFNQEEKLVSINLAEILQAQPLAMGAKEIVVNITEDGRYNIEGEYYDEEQVIAILHEAAVRNRGVEPRVQIRADQKVQFRYPLTVIGICKEENMEYSCTVLEQRS